MTNSYIYKYNNIEITRETKNTIKLTVLIYKKLNLIKN